MKYEDNSVCVWRIENWWRLKKTFNAEMVKMYFHDNSFLDCEAQSCFKGKESSNCLFSTFCKFCLKKFAPTSFSTMRWKMKTFKAVFDKKKSNLDLKRLSIGCIRNKIYRFWHHFHILFLFFGEDLLIDWQIFQL